VLGVHVLEHGLARARRSRLEHLVEFAGDEARVLQLAHVPGKRGGGEFALAETFWGTQAGQAGFCAMGFEPDVSVAAPAIGPGVL
jgi:hypothetical protein